MGSEEAPSEAAKGEGAVMPSGDPQDFLAPVSITSVSGVTDGEKDQSKIDLPPEARPMRIGASDVEVRVPRASQPRGS